MIVQGVAGRLVGCSTVRRMKLNCTAGGDDGTMEATILPVHVLPTPLSRNTTRRHGRQSISRLAARLLSPRPTLLVVHLYLCPRCTLYQQDSTPLSYRSTYSISSVLRCSQLQSANLIARRTATPILSAYLNFRYQTPRLPAMTSLVQSTWQYILATGNRQVVQRRCCEA